MGCVTEILIAASPASEMVPIARVRAVPGKGLEGDRYFLGKGTFSPRPQKPDFEITLIEQENVEAFATESGLAFTASQARRNVVTRGIRLNELVGQEFCVGEAVFAASVCASRAITWRKAAFLRRSRDWSIKRVCERRFSPKARFASGTKSG
jgi:hypothetical protein